MSFFGTRRPRQARVYRPTPSLWDRLKNSITDFRTLTQLGIATLAIILLLLAGQSWKSRFTFRAGQFATVGIQSRVEFEVLNVLETQRLKVEAERNAPLVFQQDSTVIDRLQSQFRDHLSEIANAEQLETVSARTREAFGLETGDPTTQEATFRNMKDVLTRAMESSGNRIDELVLQFSQILGGARLLGVIDTQTALRLPRVIAGVNNTPESKPRELLRNRPVRIDDAGGITIQYDVLASILLEEQLKETGRLGKVWPSDELADLRAIRGPVETWLHRNLRNQLQLNAEATEEALREAGEKSPQRNDIFAQGAVLVPAGTQLTADEQIALLWHEYENYEAQVPFSKRLLRLFGTSVMLILMVVLFGAFLQFVSPELLVETPRLLSFVVMCAITVLLANMASRDPWRAEIVPLVAAVMITAIAYSQVIAILTAFCLSLLISMSTLGDLGHFIMLITVSVTSIVPLRRIKSRMTMARAGFVLALVAFLAVWGVAIIQAHGAEDAWRNPQIVTTALKFSGWALICSHLVIFNLPFIESAFGIVTDISLVELSAVSHPLLQELARRAPGTYNHSMTVATIAEAAAEAIGANGLLTRVGAYFHDIGKMMKPEYFIENMTEGSENHHKSLAPAMSTLIIIGHVKEGIELAEENNLPDSLIQFIEQHHGTTLVEYFFHEATRKADVDHRTDADESSFRYPGPKPQSRETAVLMLADAVESASRSLKEPTPKRIQSLVHEITMKRLLDGQFDQCDLKMTEIRVVEESLIKSLLAAHHGRVKYPGQRTA
ncbi:MAG: HDIG domain-containing protein [Planctomycetaceae bacterium]|nr:HDIG domain-containing protein [Planctomycetaceae bacterium]